MYTSAGDASHSLPSALEAIDSLFGYASALGKIALRPAQQRACGSHLCGIHQLWIGFLQDRSFQISRPAKLERVGATGWACIPACVPYLASSCFTAFP